MTKAKILLNTITALLEELQAIEPIVLNVRKHTSITDQMIICSGRSTRHVQAISDAMVEKLKQHKYRPLSVTGLPNAEWVLIDYGDIILHVMLPTTRAYYNLEGLWQTKPRTALEQSS